MEWTGGCLCGDIRYRVTKNPESVAHCHCSLCRRQSGAAFTTGVFFAVEAFEWTKGKPTHFRDPVAADRGFCARCGSPLTWEPSAGGFLVFVGSLDRAEDIHPDGHYYTSTMLPWIKLDDGLPQYPEGSTDKSWNSE